MTRRKWLSPRAMAIALAAVAGLAVLGGTAVAHLVVYQLGRPKPSTVAPRAEIAGHAVEEVSLTTSDGVTLAGWHVRVPGPNAVILLHGIDANRLQGLSKAELYASLGYGVLLYDARAHGESEPITVTGGWNERHDLEAAMAYMQAEGYEAIGVNGFSMGAATITFAVAHGLAPDFVVLESCYRDVPTLIRNAAEWGGLPGFLAGPTLWLMGRRLGVPAGQLSPLACMPQMAMPTLILLGDSEFQILEPQAREMLEASGAAIKRLHVFPKAGHDNFHADRPEEFRAQLEPFLAEVRNGHGAAAGGGVKGAITGQVR